MGVKVEGISETVAKLFRIHRRTSERQKEALIQGGEDIAKLAQSNAPRKTGALERAIKSAPDRTGTRTRYEVYVGVDAKLLGAGYQKYGFRYDEHLHEWEGWKLGPISEEKFEDGHAVGPLFLARALRDLEDKIAKKLEKIAKEESLF